MAEVGRPREYLRVRRALGVLVCLFLPAGAAGQSPPPAPAAQGKIVALHGDVQHAPAARQDAWTNAQNFQSLFTSDRVRTLVASRAAILFIDETQVKLNAQAVLTVQAIKQPAGAPTAFELLRGEGWFRTKNPRAGVTIKTPAAAAAIRGTEINLRVESDDSTTLTVIEGSVNFTNPQGSLLVEAGEEATARVGQAPTKRVMLNPENAVQWALYYPTAINPADLPPVALSGSASGGFGRLRANDAPGALALFTTDLATDVWSRLGASMVHLAQGNLDAARRMIENDTTAAGADTVAAVRAQLAAIALGVGDVAAARQHLEAAQTADPRSTAALALLSAVELTQNHRARAAELAAAALKARGDSIGGLLAAADAAQAEFRLADARRHLDAALNIDPDLLRALVNRARIRFGTGDTRGAAADAAHAARLRADDAGVRSLLGFIKLANEDVAAAEADFTAAVANDPELGEPHLGLGLIQFRRGRENEGLLEMLTATLLEPHVSLYQSYLGKAYYEAKRFPEGLAALATAKRLDALDPTPWLYTSLFLRDQNQQVAALRELNEAIARNDNRAVYRSRLLLDRDLATKNISLAQVYKQLGFFDWAAYEAQHSIEADSTNASAHLFLADAYVGLPDRLQAAQGEFLQHLLYAPVNRNSFNNFAEYTGLFEQPALRNSVGGSAGNYSFGYSSLSSEGGNQHAAYSVLAEFARANDIRDSQDHRESIGGTAKFALGPSTDIFLNGSTRREVISDDDLTAAVYGRQTGRPIILIKFNDARDPNLTLTRPNTSGDFGLKHFWGPGSSLTATAGYSRLENVTEDRDAPTFSCLGFPTELAGGRTELRRDNTDRGYTLQAQQTSRFGAHQVTFGSQYYRLNKDHLCHELLLLRSAPEVKVDESDVRETGDDKLFAVFAQDEVQIVSWLHLSGGVRFQDVTYDDPSPSYRPFRVRRADPLAGASIRLTKTTIARVAAFRNINGGVFARRLAPTTIAGFPVEQNEYALVHRNEADLAVEQGWRRLFATGQFFVRKRELPILLRGEEFLPDGHSTTKGTRGALNWIAHKRMGVSGRVTFSQVENFAFHKRDVEAAAGVNFLHERGLFASVSGVYGRQRFSRTTYSDIPNSDYAVFDGSVSYEFPRKRGVAFFSISNPFNRFVPAVTELFALPEVVPRRLVRAGVTWQF